MMNNKQIFTQVKSEIYKISMLVAILIACIVSIYKSYNRKTLFLLSGYILCNFLTETWVRFLVPAGAINHYAYAIGLVVSELFLFAYMFKIASKLLTKCLSIIGYLPILYIFISHKMWLPETIINITYLSACNVLISVNLLFLVWDFIVTEKPKNPDCSIFILSTLTTFHILDFLNTSFSFTELALKAGSEFYFILITIGLNSAYYLVLALALMRLPKPNNAYAS